MRYEYCRFSLEAENVLKENHSRFAVKIVTFIVDACKVFSCVVFQNHVRVCDYARHNTHSHITQFVEDVERKEKK